MEKEKKSGPEMRVMSSYSPSTYHHWIPHLTALRSFITFLYYIDAYSYGTVLVPSSEQDADCYDWYERTMASSSIATPFLYHLFTFHFVFI